MIPLATCHGNIHNDLAKSKIINPLLIFDHSSFLNRTPLPTLRYVFSSINFKYL